MFMKFPQMLVSACTVLFFTTAAFAQSPEVQALLTEGQTAYQKGDLAAAKSAFEMVYSMDSRNVTAINFLRRIKVEETSQPRALSQDRQLAAIILPEIKFRDATLDSVFAYFKKTVERQSGGKTVISFVVQLPPEQVTTQTITLNLTNVPVTEALRYVGELANANIVYEKYAILVKPKSPATAQAPAPAPAQ
jgi:hypothetical protein